MKQFSRWPVQRINRQVAGQNYKLTDVILTAAKDVDRPIFYSVAVRITSVSL